MRMWRTGNHTKAQTTISAAHQQLKMNVFTSHYEEDGRFPSESELMEQFQVSRTTIRRAMDLLRDEGIVESRKGHGTDVLTSHRIYNRGQSNRITNVHHAEFRFMVDPVESTKHTETLVDIVSADDKTAQALQVTPATNVYRIRWLHFANDMPYLYLTNFIRMDFAPSFPEHVKGMTSLYRVLSENYGLIFTEAEETIEPIVADFISARLLEVPVGTPLLLLCRSALCNEGPLEYSQSIIRPDMMQIALALR